MANETIYPFGPGGQTPSGINIVDDLTTGGADVALSAGMGKKLNENALYAEPIYAAKMAVWTTDYTSWFGTNYGKAVNILHFSDLHGDAVNLARIVAFKNGITGLAALNTGDTVNYSWADDFSFWGTAGADGIMSCVGNHDSRSGSDWYGKTAADCYGRYFAPYISGWGVTYTADVCYYYKDWSTPKLRLIVLDVMHWDATQAAWLVSTLASAKSSGYHVICAGHCEPAALDSGMKAVPFDTIGANLSKWESYNYGRMNSAAPTAVQDFIDGGGKFVCWLTGHTHADMFRYPTSYPSQLYVAVASAGSNAHVTNYANCLLIREDGTRSQDLFNIVSVNTTRQTLTIHRVGADRDTLGRHIGTIVYDYANNEILNCD